MSAAAAQSVIKLPKIVHIHVLESIKPFIVFI